MTPLLQSIAELEALSDAGTPGPWETRSEVGEGAEVVQPGRGSFFVGLTPEGEPDIADASLIVAAVNFLRTHLPAIKRLAEGSGEPVMWQTRTAINESVWNDWEAVADEAAAIRRMELCVKHGVTCETRALYTRPPQAQGVVTEEMVEIARDAEQRHNEKFPAGPGWDALQNNRIHAILLAALNAPPAAVEYIRRQPKRSKP